MLVSLPDGIGTGAGWTAAIGGGGGGGGGVATGGGGGGGSSRTSTGVGAGGGGGGGAAGGGITGCSGDMTGLGAGIGFTRKLGRAESALRSAGTLPLIRARSITINRMVQVSQMIGSHLPPSSGSVGPVNENNVGARGTVATASAKPETAEKAKL